MASYKHLAITSVWRTFVQYGLDQTRARLHKQLKVKWQPFVPEDFLQCGKDTSIEVTNIGDKRKYSDN